MRDVRALPKAHLHLHLTGSIRPATLEELARSHGIPLFPAITGHSVPWWEESGEHNWSRFEALYEAARAVVRTSDDVRRLVLEAAEDDAADGSSWLEIQLDPSLYGRWLGGPEAALETVLEAAQEAERLTGIRIRVIVAASWARPAGDAETLARLAARYAEQGVVGFGLSNDERRGRTADFADAFNIARSAGLLAVPHGGFFSGPWHVEECVRLLGARRVGHGVAAVRDREVLELLASRDVALEICPSSYEPFGVVESLEQVPLRQLFDAGVPIALGADTPLLFGRGLADQYTLARNVLGFADPELAALARFSIRASMASDAVKAELLIGVDSWLGLLNSPRR